MLPTFTEGILHEIEFLSSGTNLGLCTEIPSELEILRIISLSFIPRFPIVTRCVRTDKHEIVHGVAWVRGCAVSISGQWALDSKVCSALRQKKCFVLCWQKGFTGRSPPAFLLQPPAAAARLTGKTRQGGGVGLGRVWEGSCSCCLVSLWSQGFR